VGGIAARVRHDLAYLSLKGLLAGARPLSLPSLRRLGRGLAWLAAALARGSGRRARRHLALAFPELREGERERIFRRFVLHTGEILGEVGWLANAPAEEILARTEFSGLHHLTEAAGPAGGAVLVTAHCGNWEWMNLAITAAGVPLTVAAREIFDPRIDAAVQELRGRFGTESALRGRRAGQKLLGALRAGRVIGLLIDQDIEAPGAFVTFFGHPAWTPTGAAVLAARAGRPIVTGFARRTAEGTMHLHFHPPLHPPPESAEEPGAAALTALLTARIEAQIRLAPEQWVWTHRRWRRQPRGGEPVFTAADFASPRALSPALNTLEF